MTDMVRTASAMAEAVKILAQDDNWRRAQAVHHPGTGGRCASCGQRRPCTIASLAIAAEVAARKAARNDDRAAVALTAHPCKPETAESNTEPIGGAA